jgi:acyl-CoA reductase-like NAD-dependent aldehyde dehydrogenase
MKAASEHLTPVVLELGGKCPVIIEPDADLLITAKRLIWGKLLGKGQTCLAPDYILTTDDVKNSLIGLFSQVIQVGIILNKKYIIIFRNFTAKM